jgi:hypothetical protein
MPQNLKKTAKADDGDLAVERVRFRQQTVECRRKARDLIRD